MRPLKADSRSGDEAERKRTAIKEFHEKIAALEDQLSNSEQTTDTSTAHPSALPKVWHIAPIIINRYSLSPNEVIELQFYTLNLFRSIFMVSLWWM
jgi:hypothetical protein